MFSLIKRLFAKESLPVDQSASEPSLRDRTLGGMYTIRNGQPTPVDRAFLAWKSGDLKTMLATVTTQTNKVERHFLLQGIVGETYRQRADVYMRELCIQHAALHVKEFASIAPALKRVCGGVLPRVTTFQKFATLLNEDRRYDEAVEVCRIAISYGLDDGTKAGFEGRITRVLKARDDT